MKTPKQIAEQNGWDGYGSIVDLRDVADIQTESYNQALTDAANKVKALSHGLDCSCDGCVARKNDVATILELRIAQPSNVKSSHSRD